MYSTHDMISQPIRSLIKIQLCLTVLLAAILGLFSVKLLLAAIIGCSISSLANLIVATGVFRYKGGRYLRQITTGLFVGQGLKIIFIASAFAGCFFLWAEVNLWVLLLSFVVTQVGSLVLLAFKDSNRLI